MRVPTHFSVWLLFTAASVLLGCGPTVDVPDKLTLYSIDGRDHFPPDQPPKTESDEKFHGYPVVGKVEVTSHEDRRMLMEAYHQGVAESERKVAGCFWPRHGIRTVQNGQTTDYVICFECLRVHVHVGDEVTYPFISEGPRQLFNDYLSKSGISVVPSRLDGKR